MYRYIWSAIVSDNYETFLQKYKDLSWTRGVLPYLGMVGRFCSDDPHFCDCQSDLVPIHCMVQPDPIDPLFLQKKSVCVDHIQFRRYVDIKLINELQVLKILHQFSPFLDPIDPPFILVLFLIDPSFLQNFRSDWVHFFNFF